MWRLPNGNLIGIRGQRDLVGGDLLEALPLADEVQFPGLPQHGLGCLGEGVVVLGGHARAVGARALDHHEVADLQLAEDALVEGLGLVGGARHEVPGLAAVAHYHVGPVAHPLALLGARHRDERVLGAVQGRAEHLGHASVELGERVARLPGGDHVLHGADHGARVGQEERARLDLELELAPGLLGEGDKLVLYGHAHDREVGRLAQLVLHAPDLVAAAQVEGVDGGELAAEVEGHARHLLPHGWVGAGADVGVDALHDEAVLLHDGLDLGEELVPDPKGGGGPAHVGLAGAPRAEAGVEAHAHAGAGALLPKAIELLQGARVDLDAHADELGKEGGELLGGEGDLFGRHARGHGTAHLVAGGGVDVEAHLVEDLEDGGVGGGLHGVASGQAEGVGEGERLGGLRAERGQIVDVGRGPVLSPDLAGERGGEKAELLLAAGGSGGGGLVHGHGSHLANRPHGGGQAELLPPREAEGLGALRGRGRAHGGPEEGALAGGAAGRDARGDDGGGAGGLSNHRVVCC
mmetsp:Transcript_9134/g.30245  ORF Transcript_9134/g.30245 Transcript_9134/m.30245 type:complete len:522 (+) Transcript_9134:145-1710(+)